MSTIRTLYTKIAALDMSFTKEAGGTTTVTGKDIDSFKRNNSFQKADIPARILLPMEEYGNAASGVPEIMNMGTGNVGGEMGWNIVDLYLHKHAGADRGYSEILPDLVRYAGNYIEVIMSNTRPTSSGVSLLQYLQTVTPIIGVYNFPVSTDDQYFGVEVRLEYKEHINPGG